MMLMLATTSHGQSAATATGTITGRIADSTASQPPVLIVVSLLREDSSLVAFTRTEKNGEWIIRETPAGAFGLLITAPKYADLRMRVVINPDTVTDVGTLYLQRASDSLPAAIVTARLPPVRMRGDTLEFNTTGIKMKTNASVEELLSRLPGVVIDETGAIFVNGKRIERLLVDGEDFFSADPTIVTKNFSADMIAKVQVLDKKSSQAEFTGVDDGQRTKTVNLVLKDNAKRGYFVKGEAGDDPQGYYNSNGIFGAFQGHKQFAILALAANNGTAGLGASSDLGGGFDLTASSGDALGASAAGGIPQVQAAGSHYADKWNGNSDHLSANSAFGHLVTRPFSSYLSQQTLPDSLYVQSQYNQSVNSSNEQSLNVDYDYLPDSVSAFRFSVGGMKKTGQDHYSASGTGFFNDTFVNASQNSIRASVNNQNFLGNLMWRLRSRKRSTRNFSLTAGISTQNNATSGYLYSVNQFYLSNGRMRNTDTTDQRKVIATSGINLNSSLNYTQTVWQNAVLSCSYLLAFNRNRSLQSTYGRGDGKYQDLIDSLSSQYQSEVQTHKATFNIQGRSHAFNYAVGMDILRYLNRQADLVHDSVVMYRYLSVMPRANLNYNLKKERTISFSYSASSQQPSIAQLQPVQNNTDPLHIILGNPKLRPSSAQNFDFSYSSSRLLNVNIGVNYAINYKEFSTRTYTDSFGRQVSQAVNVNGSKSGGLYFSLSHKLTPTGIDLGADANVSVNRSVSYLADLLCNNDSYSAGGSLSLGKYLANVYSFRIRSTLNYSYTRSSVNISSPTRFWSQAESMQLSYFPLAGFEVNTNFNYNWRQKTNVFDKNNSTFLWNAFLSKNLLRNRLVVRWQVNDILGQNAGITRSIAGNTITQTNAQIIGRYWMLSATFRFERHGKVK